jgi:hypothetical protein
MLSIIVLVIFFGMFIAQLFISAKVYKLIQYLGTRHIRIKSWSRFAAVKELKKIANGSVEEEIKIRAFKIIDLLRLSNWLFFGAIILIFLSFFINAILNGN